MTKTRMFLVLVDDTEEMSVALKFACLRANSTGGRVALGRMIAPNTEGNNWLSISNIARTEAREDAERLLHGFSDEVVRWTGNLPSLFIREGDIAEEFFELINEEKLISTAVLAASIHQTNPGPVISYMMKKGMSKVRIPITIIPGNMTDEMLEELT